MTTSATTPTKGGAWLLEEPPSSIFAPEQLWLNPDCGLQTLPHDSAVGKLRNLAEAARRVRERLR